MPRRAPLDPPDADAVAALVESDLSTAVESVRPFEAGLNAVYRVETRSETLVCKAATFATDDELRVEAALTDHLDRETPVPVPTVRSLVDPGGVGDGYGGDPEVAGVDPSTPDVDVARLIVEYVEGRNVAGVLDLSSGERERLVVESGRILAAVHDAAPVGAVGRLGVDGAAGTEPPAVVVDEEPWPSLFDSLVAETLGGLRGEGYTTGDGAFADLVDPVEAALSGGPGVETVDPALLLTDYRPANLVLAADPGPPSPDPIPGPTSDADPGAETTGDPLVAALVDVGHGPVGDGLLDLALTEWTLVDLPLGGVAPGTAGRLRDRLRGAYRERRSGAVDSRTFAPGGRYDRYRLYAAARRLTAFDYWKQFAGDGSGAAERLRSSVRELAARLR